MRFTIQEHIAKKAGKHWDLRLQMPGDLSKYRTKRDFSTTKEPVGKGTSVMRSWSIPKARLPRKGEKLLAVATEDHPLSYQNFEGEIPSGYGAGTVKLIANGNYKMLEQQGNNIKFELPKFGTFRIIPFKSNALIVQASAEK